MEFKKTILGFFSRILRFLGIIALLYVSMVFYLALTERRNAYPRAISHNEARAAIQDFAKSISCTLGDGTILNGFIAGDKNTPLLLYYPDADEDGAQFIAEVQNIPDVALVTFNYRGSADNKGTPEHKTFEPDAKEIWECATQISGAQPAFAVGRGTGAILAAEQGDAKTKFILIDPVLSIADAISAKYRILYPKFLIRAPEQLPLETLSKYLNNVHIVLDRKFVEERAQQVVQKLPTAQVEARNGNSLQQTLTKVIQKSHTND